jgi:hypothetical protein
MRGGKICHGIGNLHKIEKEVGKRSLSYAGSYSIEEVISEIMLPERHQGFDAVCNMFTSFIYFSLEE